MKLWEFGAKDLEEKSAFVFNRNLSASIKGPAINILTYTTPLCISGSFIRVVCGLMPASEPRTSGPYNKRDIICLILHFNANFQLLISEILINFSHLCLALKISISLPWLRQEGCIFSGVYFDELSLINLFYTLFLQG